MSEKNVIAGRYELIEKIGQGGMAVVYKAKCRLLKRNVAVKILKPEFTGDRKFVDNFRREAHAAASLSHPNIVGIYDVGQEGNINYIVMELVEGQTLSDLIESNGALEYREATNIATKVAQALEFANNKGIVHRDVKPHNVLIADNGDVKITDFGIARAVSDTTIVDSTRDNVMGSVHYFSPEMAKGEQVNEKSDIYSFGILLFEMLTGRVPFDGDNPVTIALMQINEELAPPSIYNQNIPPKLERIVLKSTEKNPKNRYDSFEEITMELEEVDTVTRVVGGSALIASEKDKDYLQEATTRSKRRKEGREKENTKSKKKLFIILGILLALILGVGSYFMLFSGKDIKVPDLVGMNIEEAKEKAEDLDLKIEVEKYKSSDKYKKDLIISQDPDEGEKVRKGHIIKVVVSKGNVKGIVPDVVGKKEDEAKKMIEEYGFSLGKVKEKESDKPKGTVIEQNPAAGKKVSGKTEIDLVISDGSGEGKVEVPNLIGMSEASAKTALENEGLKLGSVTTELNTNFGGEQIIWQSYNAGTKLKKGDKVDIKINPSLGTVTIKLPLSQAENEDFLVDVVVSDKLGSNRYILKGSPFNKNSYDDIVIQGSGKGTIVVKFDGVEVLRKEVSF